MARITKIGLGVVGGLLFLGFLTMTFSNGILFYFSKGESVTSAFYVENVEAALAEQHRDVAARVADGLSPGDQLSFVVAGHQLRAGSGAVIGYRDGYQEGFLGTDGDYFFELTVFLREPVSGVDGIFPVGPDTGVIAFLTRWSRQRQYSEYPAWACLAYATSGEIGFETLGDGGLSVDLSLTFGNAYAFEPDFNTQIFSTEHCAYAPLREKFVAVRREIDSLGAWEGAPGASYDEMVDWN